MQTLGDRFRVYINLAGEEAAVMVVEVIEMFVGDNVGCRKLFVLLVRRFTIGILLGVGLSTMGPALIVYG